MPHGTEEFVRRAADHGVDVEVEEFPEGTRTAVDAAEALGCGVEQIVKSLVFVADDEPLVVYTSGAHEVDEYALADEVDADGVRTASPDEVEDFTGFGVGGVPPFGLDDDLPAYVDPLLLEFDEVWAGAGSQDTVFAFDPVLLQELQEAVEVDAFE